MATEHDAPKMATAIMRADASAAIGAGHIRRVAALGHVMGRYGWRVGYATNSEARFVVPGIDSEGVIIPDGCAADAEASLLAERWPNGIDLLVVDHYGRDSIFELACRPWAKRILVIDDQANRSHDCDFLLDPSLNRLAEDYSTFVPTSCRFLLGPAYTPLREEFAAARIRQRPPRARGLHLLISMGATDPCNATSEILQALGKLAQPIGLTIDAVIGRLAPHRAMVERAVTSLGPCARLHVESADLIMLLATADLAIGAGGTSSWERCCLGVPSVVVAIAENQRSNAAALSQAGAALMAASVESAALEALRLLSEPQLLEAMRTAARRLCDGRGAYRVVSVLDPPHALDGSEVTLRPATERDGEEIFIWQRRPEIRRFARTPHAPERREHFDWLNAKIADPVCLLNIIELRGTAVGVLRLDLTGDDQWEISIYVAPEYWSRGIGRAALAQARCLVPDSVLVAHVLDRNDASHAMFRHAGFVWQDDHFVYRPDDKKMTSCDVF